MTLDEKLAKAKENAVRKQRLEAVLPSWIRHRRRWRNCRYSSERFRRSLRM